MLTSSRLLLGMKNVFPIQHKWVRTTSWWFRTILISSVYFSSEKFLSPLLIGKRNALLDWYLKCDKRRQQLREMKVINLPCYAAASFNRVYRSSLKRLLTSPLTPHQRQSDLLMLQFIPHRREKNPFGRWTNNFPFCFASVILSQKNIGCPLLDFVFSPGCLALPLHTLSCLWLLLLYRRNNKKRRKLISSPLRCLSQHKIVWWAHVVRDSVKIRLNFPQPGPLRHCGEKTLFRCSCCPFVVFIFGPNASCYIILWCFNLYGFYSHFRWTP